MVKPTFDRIENVIYPVKIGEDPRNKIHNIDNIALTAVGTPRRFIITKSYPWRTQKKSEFQ